MLDLLHRDHHRIRKLLSLLDRKAEALAAGRHIEYPMIKSVLDYLHHYVDSVHHSEEELLLAQLGDDELQSAISAQHTQLAELTERLAERVDMVLMDAIVPRDELLSALDGFVALQRAHLDFEEQTLFPALKARLSEQDIDAARQRLEQKAHQDPLFGQEVRADHQGLFDSLRTDTE